MAGISEMLQGKNINGWEVVAQIGSYPGMTGGHFSTGYEVKKDGVKAFMKAMDLHSVITQGIDAVTAATTQYTFERDILQLCSKLRLSAIIQMYEAGEFDVDGSGNALQKVYYLVFEWADGDIRRALTVAGHKTNSWKLRVLHQATVALVQLHGADIAHQDLKPSNVLAFEEKDNFKLGDLGRCFSRTFRAPTDLLLYPGDYSYAPPEYLYGELPRSYLNAKVGSDAYLLGSLIAFLFANVGALPITLIRLPEPYTPTRWAGTYQDALPYLIRAHTEATAEFIAGLPEQLKTELGAAYFNLCHPCPETRGHPLSRRQAGTPIGLDRYRSIFDRMHLAEKVNERVAARKAANA